MDWDCGLFYNTGAGGAVCRSGAVTFGCLEVGVLNWGIKKPDKSPAFVL
jgi:hypothetical protein